MVPLPPLFWVESLSLGGLPVPLSRRIVPEFIIFHSLSIRRRSGISITAMFSLSDRRSFSIFSINSTFSIFSVISTFSIFSIALFSPVYHCLLPLILLGFLTTLSLATDGFISETLFFLGDLAGAITVTG